VSRTLYQPALSVSIKINKYLERSSILVELEFGEIGLHGRRKTGEPGENPSEQVENQQQTQPTCGNGPESNPVRIGGWLELSQLRHSHSMHHPCFPGLIDIPSQLYDEEKVLFLPISFPVLSFSESSKPAW